MPNLGTRSKQGFYHTHPSGRIPNDQLTRDVGMTKNVTVSVTFSASTGKATAAGGTFVHFVVGDPIVVLGSGGADGNYTVLASDFSTYLTLDPPPKNAGPVICNIRTP